MSNVELGLKLNYDGQQADAGLKATTQNLKEFTREAQKGLGGEALKPYAAQLDAVKEKQTQTNAALRASIPAVEQLGMSAKATAAAMRGVPAQFTDIVTSLQSGQAPLTVLLQQGGQLKDMFGGIGNAGKALGTYVLGLVNPLTLAVGAAGALGVAYYQGSKEADAYAKAIILTGNAAGVTIGQLQAMAITVGQASGTTTGAAAEALAALAASSKIASGSFEQFAAVAVQAQRETGAAVADTVKQFEKLGESPLEASIKLNETTHYLTLSLYEQIKALDDQGKKSEAAALAQKAWADSTAANMSRLEANLGTAERAWRSITNVAKDAWDAMMGVGRKASNSEAAAAVAAQIKVAQTAINQANAEGGLLGRARAALLEAEIPKLQQKLLLLQGLGAEETKAAAQSERQAKQVAARIEVDRRGEEFKTKAQKMAKEILETETLMVTAGAKREEIEKRILDIKEKYADKATGSKKTTGEYDALFARQEQMAKIAKELGAELKALEKAHEDYAKSIEAALAPLEREAATLETQLQNYGLTRSEIEATIIARLNEKLALESLKSANEENIAYLEREIEARQRIAEASAGLAARKATDDAAKHAADAWKKTADKIGDSITDALMRGFESGKSFAQTLRDTIVNMFKAMVLRPVIQATVMGGVSALGLGGSSSAMAQSAGGGASALGATSSVGNAYSLLKDGGTGAVNSLAFSDVGQTLGLSTAGAVDAVQQAVMLAEGASMEVATLASTTAAELTSFGATLASATPYLPFVGAAIQAFSGDVKGAAMTAAGAAIGSIIPGVGTAIGGLVGSLVGSLFGGKKAAPSSAVSVYSQYSNGVYGVTGMDSSVGAKFNSASSGPASTIGKQVSDSLGGLFKSLGKSLDLQYTSSMLTRGDGKQYSAVGGTINGASIGFQIETYGKVSQEEAVKKATELAMGKGIVTAITASNLSAPVKALFDGLVDSTIVQSMIAGLAKVGTASKALDEVWGISVDDAATLSILMNTTKEGMAATLGQIGAVAAAQRGQGAILADAYQALSTAISVINGSDLPQTLKEYDAAMKAVDTTVDAGRATFAYLLSLRGDFAAFRAAIDSLKLSASNAIDTLRSPEQLLSSKQATLSELSQSAGIAAPTSGAQLVALFDSIDFASPTKEGLDLAKALPDIATAFSAVEAANKSFADALVAAAQAAADKAKAIADERANLQDTLDDLTMSSVQRLNKQRDALDESNRALFDQINALNAATEAQKAAAEAATLAAEKYKVNLASARAAAATGVDTAFAALQRAVNAQKAAVDAAYADQAAALKDSVGASTKIKDSLTALVSALAGAIKSTVVVTDALTLARREAAQSRLDTAVSAARSGQSLAPFADSITAAIDDLTTPSENLYATFTDYARSQGRANAALVELQSKATAQGSVADMTLEAINAAADTAEKAYKEELRRLDQTVADAQISINILRGIDVSILSVAAAIANLDRAKSAAAGVPVTASPSKTVTNAWVDTADGQYYQSGAGAVGTRAKASDPYTITGKNGLTTSAKSAVDYVTAALAANDPMGVYNTAKEWGVSLASLDAMMGWSTGTAADWARKNNLPTFAKGTNYLPSDMTAQIHEGERIIPAADNRLLMERLRNPNDANAALIAEIKALREEIRSGQAQIASNTGRVSRLLDRAMPDGDALATRVAT